MSVLANVRCGDIVEVTEVDDPTVRIQCLRLGLQPGSRLECVRSLHEGPVVVRCGNCELAIGRPIAKEITVRPAFVESESDGKACSARKRTRFAS